MRANYHTHTYRCNHAGCSDQRYVDLAIEAGLEVLGFSDHTPYVGFEGDFYSFYRMLPEQLSDYVESLGALRAQYEGKIELHIGLEAEYYPKLFWGLLEFLRPYGIEYLILGQHYIDDGAEKEHVMRGDGSNERLTKYVDTVIAGINTGKFSYVAHPDVVSYTGDGDFYKAEMKRLCLAAKAAGIPLELNCVGVMKNRCYPNDKFWRIAGDVANSVIIGVDAHSPAELMMKENVRKCEEISRRFELFPLRELKFINPKG